MEWIIFRIVPRIDDSVPVNRQTLSNRPPTKNIQSCHPNQYTKMLRIGVRRPGIAVRIRASVNPIVILNRGGSVISHRSLVYVPRKITGGIEMDAKINTLRK